jgi:hypothetical protein
MGKKKKIEEVWALEEKYGLSIGRPSGAKVGLPEHTDDLITNILLALSQDDNQDLRNDLKKICKNYTIIKNNGSIAQSVEAPVSKTVK